MQTKITIVTVTLTSVANQTYPFIEYIIVDGQSVLNYILRTGTNLNFT